MLRRKMWELRVRKWEGRSSMDRARMSELMVIKRAEGLETLGFRAGV